MSIWQQKTATRSHTQNVLSLNGRCALFHFFFLPPFFPFLPPCHNTSPNDRCRLNTLVALSRGIRTVVTRHSCANSSGGRVSSSLNSSTLVLDCGDTTTSRPQQKQMLQHVLVQAQAEAPSHHPVKAHSFPCRPVVFQQPRDDGACMHSQIDCEVTNPRQSCSF
jgi:hypothetical protein